nr:glycosyltransferase [uncultured Gellertiella sp.]
MRRLLVSLAAQTDRHFEIIFVDQNRDDRLKPLLDEYADRLTIRHHMIKATGATRARNAGVALARGDWLMFPDDDAWYPPGMVAKVFDLIRSVPADFYSGRGCDTGGRSIMVPFPERPLFIDEDTLWTTAIEWLFVIRTAAFNAIGGFDPDLGVGAGTPYGAYEICDLMLRSLRADQRGYYDPNFNGHHDFSAEDLETDASIEKMLKYSGGLGYLIRKHRFGFFKTFSLIKRPLAGSVIFFVTGRFQRARRSRTMLRGVWTGWRASRPSPDRR